MPKDDFSDIAALANEGGGKDDFSDIAAMAGEPAAPAGEPAPRSTGESFLARTVGRLPGALDRALGGLPSTAAGVAGALSAGDEHGVTEALKEGGGTSERLLNVLLGAAELGLTAKNPIPAAQAAGVGALTERATGSREAGDVSEILHGVGQAAKTVGRGIVGGTKRLFGGDTAEKMVTEGLGAERSAQEVGKELQTPGGKPSYAQEAISRTSKQASDVYGEAQNLAKAANVSVPPGNTILTEARRAIRDAKRSGQPLTGGANRVVKNIIRLGRGQKSKLLNAAGQPLSQGSKAMPVDQLIEEQSNLRREINGLAKDDPSRRPLIALSQAIDDAMGTAAQGTEVEPTLAKARQIYRDTTIPTRKTAGRLAAAETPEQAARMATGPKTPSRFERVTGAVPEAAEPLRSAAFNEMVQGSMKGGKLNMMALSDKLDAAEASGQLKNLADSSARRLTIKAVRKVAAAQRLGASAPVGGGIIGAGAGGVGGPVGSALGVGSGYLLGRAVQKGMTSEPVARALYRLASAKRGSPGWKLALKALKATVGTVGPAARAVIATQSEEQ